VTGAGGRSARVVASPVARERVDRARAWLAKAGAASEVIVVAATTEAAAQLARRAGGELGAAFGWHRFTLMRLAGELAKPALARRGLSPASVLSVEALASRTFHVLARAAGVGRFEPIRDRPGLPRALGRTLDELRLAGVRATGDADLDRILAAYAAELAAAKLADRAEVLALATARATEPAAHRLLDRPVLLLDVALRSALDEELVRALAARSADVLATVPTGDDATLGRTCAALGTKTIEQVGAEGRTALGRLQAGLFSESGGSAAAGDDVVVFSAPGESRECVEIARRIRAEAERGTRFDEIAVVLRSVPQYRAHLEEALRRASIPAYFARGAVRPDPAGRAMLALLACAAEGLSARRFAEYLSLGEVPDADAQGAPPPPVPSADRFTPPDHEIVADAVTRVADEEEESHRERRREGDLDAESPSFSPPLPVPSSPVVAGTLRAPRHWEKILVDAAVIGGSDRWVRRLDGYAAQLARNRSEVPDAEDAQRAAIDRDLGALAALRGFALPLLAELERLPTRAPWGPWLDALTALATRALRAPERVLAVLAELAPMASVGPIELGEVRLVLEKRLAELVVRPTGRPAGRVYVASADDVRGLSLQVVFVPGLAEKIFPQKVAEDPMLTDEARSRIEGARLRTKAERAADERLALRVAVGAARERAVLSYPRIDVEQSRPRTPSFYALEVLRAATGRLPSGFDELARSAEQRGEARIGWPAPEEEADAIDDAEHDLALLARVMKEPEATAVGKARYLLTVNPHLARALRFRARRWTKKWNQADGLVDVAPEARAALDAHLFAARSFSPTALQNFALCPYKLVLQALHRLTPREDPAPLEELDPLQKGSLVHETLYSLLVDLRERGLLPVTPANLEQARERLDATLEETAKRAHDDLAPAIEGVWVDGIEDIEKDLRHWLYLSSQEEEWVPAHFELAFGLTDPREKDPRSQNDPVALDVGVKLRGSIDLVERNAAGEYRVVDFKTGKARMQQGAVIAGGQTLQPVLYALAVEKLFGAKVVEGVLDYLTTAGGFEQVSVAFDAEARDAAGAVVATIGRALKEGFLPAAPAKGACEWCDYKVVCGPYEEERTRKKAPGHKGIEALQELRRRR
jgi:CRISPR/Cas system-associated exonuclease Cas4 (RecB family)